MHERDVSGVGSGVRLSVVLYVAALVAAVVLVDVFFFRHQFAARLVCNVGIVLVFAVVGLFLRKT